MPVGDFYVDFARAHFGPAVAEEAGAIMASLDGMGFRPDPSGWMKGPGGLKTGTGFHAVAQAKGEIVERFSALREQITAAGDLERFDYWQHTFAANITMCELAASRADLGNAVNRMTAEKNEAAKKRVKNLKILTLLHDIGMDHLTEKDISRVLKTV